MIAVLFFYTEYKTVISKIQDESHALEKIRNFSFFTMSTIEDPYFLLNELMNEETLNKALITNLLSLFDYESLKNDLMLNSDDERGEEIPIELNACDLEIIDEDGQTEVSVFIEA